MKLFMKHFTIVNIITGLISLFIGLILKFTPLASVILNFCGFDSIDLNQYILAGFISLTFRLGIKGVVEAIVEEIFPSELKINVQDLLNPDAGPAVQPPARPPAVQPAGQPPAQASTGSDLQPVDRSRRPRAILADNIAAWATHNYQGRGFRIENGMIIVDNPNNITSFYDNDGRPNRTREGIEYANNILRAFTYHNHRVRVEGIGYLRTPTMDDNSFRWFRECVGNTSGRRLYNSVPNRRKIERFIR
jgi:hypothetical protein